MVEIRQLEANESFVRGDITDEIFVTQLIHQVDGVVHDLGYQIVYGASDNPAPFFDNRNAFRLGYRPQDRAVDFLADESLLRAEPDQASQAGFFIGGHFVE